MSKALVLERFDEFPSYKGGHTCLYGGYVWEFLPGHPLQNHWGWVAQHRLVAEDMLGRPLVQSKDHRKAEAVHHRDEDKTNNSPDNLEVMIRRDHLSHHGKLAVERHLSKLSAADVAKALEGRTIREAARTLGVTHMTLRRRWPELVAARKRRSPCNIRDPKWPGILRPYAADPRWTLEATAKAVGIGQRSVTLICQAHGIPWVANKSEGRTGRPKGSKNKKATRRG